MQEIQEMQVWSLSEEDALEEGMAPMPVFLENTIDRGPQGHKELNTTEVS